MHNVYASVDFLNSGIDKQGDLHLYMFDTYDFNKNENSPLIKAGVDAIKKGELEPEYILNKIQQSIFILSISNLSLHLEDRLH